MATTCGRDLASALSGSVSAGLRRSGRSVASRVNASGIRRGRPCPDVAPARRSSRRAAARFTSNSACFVFLYYVHTGHASSSVRCCTRGRAAWASGGAGGRRVDPDSTHATALACDTWRFETIARYDTFLGCLLPLAAALADRQTDTTRHSERRGHVFIFESYTYRPTATFAPESKADLLHERRMRERKQGDSNSCPGSSCGKAGRQDCAPVLSLSCTPGRTPQRAHQHLRSRMVRWVKLSRDQRACAAEGGAAPTRAGAAGSGVYGSPPAAWSPAGGASGAESMAAQMACAEADPVAFTARRSRRLGPPAASRFSLD